ncbi:hypothetical protein NKG94_40160 [Micromonospora sp. M12]
MSAPPGCPARAVPVRPVTGWWCPLNVPHRRWSRGRRARRRPPTTPRSTRLPGIVPAGPSPGCPLGTAGRPRAARRHRRIGFRGAARLPRAHRRANGRR